jgi:hypothetical protein
VDTFPGFHPNQRQAGSSPAASIRAVEHLAATAHQAPNDKPAAAAAAVAEDEQEEDEDKDFCPPDNSAWREGQVTESGYWQAVWTAFGYICFDAEYDMQPTPDGFKPVRHWPPSPTAAAAAAAAAADMQELWPQQFIEMVKTYGWQPTIDSLSSLIKKTQAAEEPRLLLNSYQPKPVLLAAAIQGCEEFLLVMKKERYAMFYSVADAAAMDWHLCSPR